MAVKQPIKRRRGRPLKEESNAIAVEKAILDGNTTLIALIPDAYQVLKDLMVNTATKDNIRENIAKYVIEKGESLNSQYNAEDEADETERVSETGKQPEAQMPFTTDIIPISKAK
ncbi:hypothetical protein pEaSNUABM56_00152 [Erwinia phage pEa_SNUABM_56]|uniref:Uncharacterized protein n=1 Tax=Erwinia phage pEp_SNUABM_01 TaxID=2601643 RepID=A0A5J6DAN4_9CAUD|nr:hypothetical protein HWC63_gp244 [Erwinia phage pEp_SNUABM_01]QEQ94934.1 hypothetical protein pEpSNUABM01_108 [Erwinia phage pEp_SNUABM_01]UYL84862.1 hypothetical protein pEaSNUABM55_00083 [Erwinia phage pEa_SNUABM_55]UYL85178.1 hypothetical protein pEaSNUABM56_00152 [Erwinia phage pEa_SNUABM_56]